MNRALLFFFQTLYIITYKVWSWIHIIVLILIVCKPIV